MREGCKSSWASKAWGSGAGKGVNLTGGARLTERRGRAKEATDTRAGWAGRDDFGLRGWRGPWVGRAESKEKNF
jgi:hypothetical protein